MVIKQPKSMNEAFAMGFTFSLSLSLSLMFLMTCALFHKNVFWELLIITLVFWVVLLLHASWSRTNKLVIPNAEDVLKTGVIYERTESGCLWVPYQTNPPVGGRHDYISYVQIRHPYIGDFVFCAFEDLVPKRFRLVTKSVFNEQKDLVKVNEFVPVSDEELKELEGKGCA